MKVLLVNKFLHPQGGSETYTFKVGEHLSSLGHQVEYFGMEHEGRTVGNKINAYTSDMDFHSKGLVRLLYPLKIIYSREAKKQILKVLEDFNPDIVHINNFNFQLTPSILYGLKSYEKKQGRRIKVLYTAHDYQLICPNHMLYIPGKNQLCEKCIQGSFLHCAKNKCIHNSGVKSILGSLEGYLYSVLGTYKRFDRVICPSYFMEQKLVQNKVFRKKTVPLHNFIIQQKMVESKCADKEYVLYFGRYSAEKGIHTLLEACKELPFIPFRFAGSGPLEDEIVNIPNVENVGFQSGEQLADLIIGARFTIIASEWYENCPFSVMESQMYGTPVLGADIGGIPELIREDSGLLFESGNKEDLVIKIKELWDNQEICDSCRKNCSADQFDTIESYCEKLIELYQS